MNVYVKAYYNESISVGDNGHQVNLMFFADGDGEYFAEEFIGVDSSSDAEELADKINKEGFENFKPQIKNNHDI